MTGTEKFGHVMHTSLASYLNEKNTILYGRLLLTVIKIAPSGEAGKYEQIIAAGAAQFYYRASSLLRHMSPLMFFGFPVPKIVLGDQRVSEEEEKYDCKVVEDQIYGRPLTAVGDQAVGAVAKEALQERICEAFGITCVV